MSDPCSCPLAGWCDRHDVRKNNTWHQLCQSKDNYRAAWDEGRGPGQPKKPLTPAQLERQQRIKEASQRTQRLIGWMTFFRLPDEQGVGDTASRLANWSPQNTDAHTLIKRLLTMCSCSRSDAIAKLNAEYPYPANTRNLGGS